MRDGYRGAGRLAGNTGGSVRAVDSQVTQYGRAHSPVWMVYIPGAAHLVDAEDYPVINAIAAALGRAEHGGEHYHEGDGNPGVKPECHIDTSLETVQHVVTANPVPTKGRAETQPTPTDTDEGPGRHGKMPTPACPTRPER